MFESASGLGELWENEEIYFQPKDSKRLQNWTGSLYYYKSNVCFDTVQANGSEAVTAKEVKCDAGLLTKAKEPYAKILDFDQYRSRILDCLNKSDQKCLRGLIAKTLQISFGVDPIEDRRDYIFANWKKEDFTRLRDLIKKGTVGEGDSRTFPPVVSDEGMGHRGKFLKGKNGWLLVQFLAGD